jgi:RES domain-containing protein
LDTKLLLSDTGLILHRLAQKKYANLSGIGAAKDPGRWNLPDQEAIYTSLNSSTTILERFVHTNKSKRPTNLATMTISLPGRWEIDGSILVNRSTGAAIHVFSSLQQAHSEVWGVIPSVPPPLGIAVPSVLDAHWNVVLYPANPSFWPSVRLIKITPFRFDIRMFPMKAPKKSAVKPTQG